MRTFLTLLLTLLTIATSSAQTQQHSIEIDASSFTPVQTDAISGVAIDKIGKDHSQRECARIKMRMNRMTAAEIGELAVRPRGGNVEVMKCVVASEGNGLIIELTAKEPTRFYLSHPKHGDSNEVSLNLAGGKEYTLSAELCVKQSIVVESNTAGADVYIDNVFKGQIGSDKKLTINDIQRGEHSLRVLQGSQQYTATIDVNDTNIHFRANLNTATSRPQYVIFEVLPKNASVKIDQKSCVLDTQGFTQTILNNGTYTYEVSAQDYHTESGTFEVNGAKVEKRVELKPAYGWLTIGDAGTLKDANIYVDNNFIGKSPIKQHKLSSGTHQLRIVKELYVTIEESISISDNKELSFNRSLVADFATVTLDAKADCDIYVNGTLKGKSPWTGKLSSGTYIFEARKEGYSTTVLSKTIGSEPAVQSYTLDTPMPIIGTVNVSCVPYKADLYIDGELVGTTPMMYDLHIGSHKITIRKEGYEEENCNVTIAEGELKDVNLTLKEKSLYSSEHNVIKYTSSGGKVNPYSLVFGANIVSNEYDATTGLGVIVFDKEVTTIGYKAFLNCSNLKDIAIPSSVTTIGQDAFRGCSITSITIPDSVTSIGESAFYGSTNLQLVEIGNGITEIGKSVFEYCSNLTKVTIGNNVKFIREKAFYQSGVVDIYIPDSVTTIESSAFCGCKKLKTITIGNGVTTIGNEAFNNCVNLASVKIGKSVFNVKSNAFANCDKIKRVDIYDLTAWCNINFENEDANPIKSYGKFYLNDVELTELTIPADIIKIKNYTFRRCYSITKVNLHKKITSIGVGAFWDCDSVRSFNIPDSVTSIGKWAFLGCNDLSSVDIGKGVSTIGYAAFRRCSITSITIPDNVTKIDDDAFSGCEQLTSVTIGAGIKEIGELAFEDCPNLKTIFCKAITPPSMSYYDSYYSRTWVFGDYKYIIYVPRTSVAAYKSKDGWSSYDIAGYDFE